LRGIQLHGEFLTRLEDYSPLSGPKKGRSRIHIRSRVWHRYDPICAGRQSFEAELTDTIRACLHGKRTIRRR
jgi:hypothetical protein